MSKLTEEKLTKDSCDQLASFRFQRFLFGVTLALSIGLITGCSKSTNNASFNVSGKVTLDGKPVPAGRVRFAPDGSKGNKGQVGFAKITDGTFNTALGERSQGIEGGFYVIKVNGFDGEAFTDDEGFVYPDGKVIFQEYSIKKELPASDSTIDIEIDSKDLKKSRKQ